MPHITLVKKRFADGSFCRKCEEVSARLDHAGLSSRIDRVVIADEANFNSEGMQLALQHQVEHAPFFIVETEHAPPKIYTVYLQFLKEVLQHSLSVEAENQALVEQVDFL